MNATAERIGYQEKINNLFGIYRESCPLRDDKLFLDFLPTGYELTTLSSVPKKYMRITIPAKLCLGMMITLYDDLADNPSYYNPKLLEELYKLPLQTPQSKNLVGMNDLKIANLANILHENMFKHLKKLPNYFKYKEMFLFDLGNFYQANKLAEHRFIP